ncbi:MAG: 50S ribosome-binding GTPase [Planctomycetota bacterium]|nr:50S ribosome-binding GTPase [Planctomycetota bacterium]
MTATTIAAIASPPGPGARGIVRLSGPGTRAIVRRMVRASDRASAGESTRAVDRDSTDAPPELVARALVEGRLDDGRGTQPVLVLWMPGPRSYTGEDVAELHVPGSPPLLAAVLERVLALGAVPARPGEFTRRAFENGRIDLTRAEGVAELVAARNDAEARAAGALLLGGLGTRLGALRDALEDLRALCEASLDFDEADTGHVATAELAEGARTILARLDEALGFERARTRASGAPRVVLCGAPNAGKSALFNALAGAGAAIVSDLAGTTRDTLEVGIELDGRAARLLDTPGLDLEAAGVDRAAQTVAREYLASADVALWVVDAAAERGDSGVERGDPRMALGLVAERARIPAGIPVVLAWNKVDLPRTQAAPESGVLGVAAVALVSAARGTGLEALRSSLAAALEGEAAGETGALGRDVARRHVRGLEAARAELEFARDGLADRQPLDLVAEHLRRATLGLDEIRGVTTPEDLLDRIFARFCLGK